MKKFITAAAFAATLGAASSVGFAAANPFEDVPADHWANQAIAELSAAGVIEGYGDGTYRGDQEITRYEVAQIVAKAMAKDGISAANKATLDKLAAEFASELDSLGVRVSALEKKVDNIKWTGLLAYEYWNDQHKAAVGDTHINRMQFRLEPRITINKHWSARARLKFLTNDGSTGGVTSSAKTAANGTRVQTDRVWATGTFGKLVIKLGKLPYETMYDRGMVMGSRVMGGQVTFGNKLQAILTAGRINVDPDRNRAYANRNFQSVELNYKASKKLNIGAAYIRVQSDDLRDGTARSFNACLTGTQPKNYGDDSQGIIGLGVNYKFSKLWDMNLAYSYNHGGDWEGRYKRAYNVEFDYNGGRYPAMKKGNFGAFVAYRYMGRAAVVLPTYDETYTYWGNGSIKGLNVGAAYAFDKNILGTVLYFHGKDLLEDGDKTAHIAYSTLQFFF